MNVIFNSKDYFIISIRYYASDYYLKKWHNSGIQPKQHWERAKSFNDFTWKFIEKSSGKSMKWWYCKYISRGKDAAIEFLDFKKNIIIQKTHEKWCRFYIPKNNKKLINWTLKN